MPRALVDAGNGASPTVEDSGGSAIHRSTPFSLAAGRACDGHGDHLAGSESLTLALRRGIDEAGSAGR